MLILFYFHMLQSRCFYNGWDHFMNKLLVFIFGALCASQAFALDNVGFGDRACEIKGGKFLYLTPEMITLDMVSDDNVDTPRLSYGMTLNTPNAYGDVIFFDYRFNDVYREEIFSAVRAKQDLDICFGSTGDIYAVVVKEGTK